MAIKAKIKETEFFVGDKIQVSQKIQEGDKTRIQVFEGIVIAIKGEGENKMFTVRKIATGGIGVERIWPLNTPWIEKIKVMRKGKVKRAKLYFLREAPNNLKFVNENQKSGSTRGKSRPSASKK